MKNRAPEIASRYGYAFAIVSVVVSTGVFLLGRDFFDKGQWALLYLLLITMVSAASGFSAALLAALCSFFAWNFFFLPPYGTFWIDDPKDWLFLFVFLLVGVAMGYQTGQLRKREKSAITREREMRLLNRLTTGMVSEPTSLAMTKTLLKEIKTVMSASMAVLYLSDGEGNIRRVRTSVGEEEGPVGLEACVRWVHENGKILADPCEAPGSEKAGFGELAAFSSPSLVVDGAGENSLFLPLATPERVEGVLFVGEKMDGEKYSLYDLRLLSSVVGMAAGYLERQRLQGAASLAETLKEADKLKSALVSSVSHELKTPLSAITATITGLLEEDVEVSRNEIKGELKSVRMNLYRLSGAIESLLDLSRLESDAWRPKREWNDLGEMLGAVLSRFSQEQIERFRLDFPDPAPVVNVDFQQWGRLLFHLAENAVTYDSSGKEITFGAAVREQGLRMWVEDNGPGVGEDEEHQIFQKFHRGKASENVPGGTGLGLAVAREIVIAHGGSIFLEQAETGGARFVVQLPGRFVRKES